MTTQRPLALLDAPSNLGLRPPAPGCVPGCAKLAGTLRDQQLLARLGAMEGGVVTPPRYVPEWAPGQGVRNAAAMAAYTRRLAERIGQLLDGGAFPVVLGGDCSILLGAGLALRQRSPRPRLHRRPQRLSASRQRASGWRGRGRRPRAGHWAWARRSGKHRRAAPVFPRRRRCRARHPRRRRVRRRACRFGHSRRTGDDVPRGICRGDGIGAPTPDTAAACGLLGTLRCRCACASGDASGG